MGCSSSSQGGSETSVATGRRRLSVGHVEASGTEETGNVTEEDRGLITKLNEQSLIDMLQDDSGRKFSLGSATDQGKTSFANKSMQKMGENITTTGMGFTCRKGLKPEAPNQDSWSILRLETHSMYSVFDGHGQKGHDVSNFVKENLPKLILRDNRFKEGDEDQQKTMLTDCFKKVQSLVVTCDRLKKLSAQMSGTTATLCIHDHSAGDAGTITVAHVADSTCVLGHLPKGAKKDDCTATSLTRDHKPNLKDERQRIEKAGGRVVFDGYANHRVYAKNARYPGLNMSRCLGDLMGHQDCGLSCEPEVTKRTLTANDAFLFLCSDGVWEFTQPIEATKLVAEFPKDKAQQAAERLAKEAWDRWITEEGGAVVDDITVILIYLQEDSNGGD